MDKGTWARTVAAGSVAAAGLTLGGIGLAGAADDAGDGDRIERGFVMRGPLHDDLADELGVSEEELADAFEAIREDIDPPAIEDGPPSEEEIEAHESELAAALAEELGLSADTVEAAFEKQRTEHRADRRADLVDRLDDAVAAGDLSAADKASVLKAFDAGVLGHGPGFGAHRR